MPIKGHLEPARALEGKGSLPDIHLLLNRLHAFDRHSGPRASARGSFCSEVTSWKVIHFEVAGLRTAHRAGQPIVEVFPWDAARTHVFFTAVGRDV